MLALVVGVWIICAGWEDATGHPSGRPSTWLGFFSAFAACALVLLAAAAERLGDSFSMRSSDQVRTPLSPAVQAMRPRDNYATEPRTVVLIPAHDEESSLPSTLSSLLAQTHRPDEIVVIADNCRDNTASIARSFGATVLVTENNRERKAGALNQAFVVLSSYLADNDVLIVFDADTRADAGFVSEVITQFHANNDLCAVGALFRGEKGGGILGQLQRNEFARYARDIRRRGGRVFVLTGTATAFRVAALRQIAASRGRVLPGDPGCVYDTWALTEDNEITFALKTLGARVHSTIEGGVETEVMRSWRALHAQRLRWQRGAVENLSAYGFVGRLTRYWFQQLSIAYSTTALTSLLVLLTIQILDPGSWTWYPFWLLIGGLFTVEKVVSSWNAGWSGRFLATLLIPELLYDIFLCSIFVEGLISIARGRHARWSADDHPDDALKEYSV